MSSGGVIAMSEASQGFQVETQEPVNMSMNMNMNVNVNVNPTNSHVVEAPAMAPLQSTAIVAVPTPNFTGETEFKKKRGRPRKYGPGSSMAPALSPMPISASIPLSGGGGGGGGSGSGGGGGGDLSIWKQHHTTTKVKPFQPLKKAHKSEVQGTGDQLAYLVGADFTSHVITVNAGEDVAMKIQSFSQEGSRAICVLSASGSIANVTLRQPSSAGGTLTYEGRFEILSLSGSFMPTENGTLRSRSGGLSVSLAGTNGHVFGGGLAGLLIAANPVQVVVGSFLPGNQAEPKAKKQRVEPVWAPPPGPALASPFNGGGGGGGGGQTLSFSSPPLTHTDPVNSTQTSKDADTDNNLSSSSFHGDSDEGGFEI